MPSPPVLLRGSLAQSPLPELLVRFLDEQLAGTLVLQEPSGAKSAVLIVRGAPAKARLAQSPVYLADVLNDLGILSAELRARYLEETREAKQHLGQWLVRRGEVDDTSLYVALREQLRRQVLFLCDLPPGTAFGLYQANYLDAWGASAEWRVKPLPLIWRALVDKARPDRVALALQELGDRRLRMRFEAPIMRYHMDKSEAALVNVLRAKPQPVAELLRSGVATEERVRCILYALHHTRQLDLGVPLREPVGLREPPESPQSVPPPRRLTPSQPGHVSPSSRRRLPSSANLSRSPSQRGVSDEVPSTTPPTGTPVGSVRPPCTPEQVQAFEKELERREQLEKADFYEVLEVDRRADVASIRASFFKLAKNWHPDRLAPELEHLRERVTRVFARMSEAHQVLSDPQQRAQYEQALTQGDAPEEQEQVLAVLRAATAFQRAEVLMKKRDDVGALKEARAAYEGDPSQAEYAALYAWLEARQRKEDFAELIRLMDGAVEREPENVRIRWYRGQLLKRAGKEAMAMREFRRVVELSPGHVEAQRELRVYEMRRRSESGAHQGLFSRWRKK
ncbi:MAG: DnaJ domain-containing protein [Myxococcales bacterium]|nr:DnaJ domain-containing protein [Myxococcales bacterium]